MNFLKSSPRLKITTEDLLLIVESTGNQQPYESKVNLCRRVLTSLHAFVRHCHQRVQCNPQSVNVIKDPFDDGFRGQTKTGVTTDYEPSLRSRKQFVIGKKVRHCARSVAEP